MTVPSCPGCRVTTRPASFGLFVIHEPGCAAEGLLRARAAHLKVVAATARRTDPDTSQAAAAQARRHSQRDELLVLHTLAQLGPSTDHEIADHCGRLQTSLGVRRKALVDRGLVEWSGQKRPTQTGVLARVWQLTEAGHDAATTIGDVA